MSNTTKKPGNGFWIIGIVALIWNLMGVFAYLQNAYMSAEDFAALPTEQQALLENVPAWVTGAFAIAVFGGALACILLLMRKKLATIIFLVSLIGIIVQMSYNVFMSKALEVYGPGGMVMPVMVLVVGIFLWQYSKKQESKGILS
jgi:hypothetical protein